MTTLVSTLAKDWVVQANDKAGGGTFLVPEWVTIKGLSKVDPGVSESTEDDSDIDSDGWGSEVVTQRKWKLDLEGFRKRDAEIEDFTADPGQELLRAAGDLVGVGGTLDIQYYRKDGDPAAYRGFVSVSYSPTGGDVKGLQGFKAGLMGNGKRAVITNPLA
jgi:hypothetical protein